MAASKSTSTRKKPQYVKGKKRKGTEPPALARRSVTIVLLLLLLAGAWFGIRLGFGWIGQQLMAENTRFEIQHLIISSDGKLTEDRIREWTDLNEGMNLWAVTFDEIEHSLSDVPIIESVQLERKLPHTLIIQVKERVAVARISGEVERRFPFLADRYGFVLPPRRSAKDLPLIQGVDEDLQLGQAVKHADVETSLKIIGLCESTAHLRDFVHIESLNVQYSDFIDMHLEDGIRVRMPRYSLKPKLMKLATIIKRDRGLGLRIKSVNLTLDAPKVPVTYYN